LLIAALLPLSVRSVSSAQEPETLPEPASDVLTVTVPDNLDFKIDPYALAGRGQIYSESFAFVNDGPSDLLLSFVDARVALPNADDYLLSDRPVGLDFESEKKAICLALLFDAPQERSAILTGADLPDISLLVPANGGSAAFAIGGSVNDDPDDRWYDGEVKISVTYRFAPLPRQEADAQEAGAEAAQGPPAGPETPPAEQADDRAAVTREPESLPEIAEGAPPPASGDPESSEAPGAGADAAKTTGGAISSAPSN
jgi:hypothetical protein